jgi:hypothetical protein
VVEHLHVTVNCPRRYLLLYPVASLDSRDDVFGIISGDVGGEFSDCCNIRIGKVTGNKQDGIPHLDGLFCLYGVVSIGRVICYANDRAQIACVGHRPRMRFS